MRSQAGINRRQLLATAAGGAAASLAAVGPARAQPRARDTVTFGLSPYPPNLRPFEHTGTASTAVKLVIHRSLLSYDRQGRLTPGLAQSWALDGPRAYRFRLRENAFFHNGEPVRARDVVSTFEAISGPRSTAFLKSAFEMVERIEVIDPLELRFVLREPSASLPHFLASYNAPIISEKSPDMNRAIGAGPYRVTAMERGRFIDVERFDRFWAPGLPRTRRIRFLAYAEDNTRAAAVQAGDVDIIQTAPWQFLQAMEGRPELRLASQNGAFFALTFNTQAGPFTDARLRQAICFAVDREEIVSAVCYGYGKAMTGMPIPEGTVYGESAAGRQFGHDPDRARQLMAAAGHPNGFETTLLCSSTSAGHQPTAEIVQQQLRRIGIRVNLNLVDFAKRVQMGNLGQYEFAVHGLLGQMNDPDGVSQYIGAGPPSHVRSFGFRSDRIEQLLQQGRQELDEARRVEIYDELQREAGREAPICPLAWRSQVYAMQRHVRHFENLPGFLSAYSPVTLTEVEAG